MFNTLLNSFRLSNAYYANTLIYRLKKLPIIKKIIPSTLYASKGLKIFANILSTIIKVLFAFIGKFIYLSTMVVLPLSLFKGNLENNFINILFFLSILGSFTNTQMFNPTKEKYYSVVLMRMNSKKYALSSFYWFLIKIFVTFLPSLIAISYIYNIDLLICLMMPLFIVLIKIIGSFILLKYYEIKRKTLTENNLHFISVITIIGLLLAYGLPYINFVITKNIFLIAFVITVIMSVSSLRHIMKSSAYKIMYKKMLTLNSIIFNATEVSSEKQKGRYSTKMDNNISDVTSKKGYDYFNEIFFQRHKTILTKSAKKIALISALIIIFLGIATIFNPKICKEINNLMLTFLPYFVFIMYFTNRGSAITQAMFINCDHSMLAYRFYRQPKVILNLFKKRLKTLIKINMIPTLVIAIGLPCLLFITGGTSNYLNYVLLFAAIIAMAIFFSVHHLVIYYLLQPYNINMESKSSMYAIVNMVTYMVCYFTMQLRIPTIIFATMIILFSIVYVCLSLYLAFKYAPKTFKLKN